MSACVKFRLDRPSRLAGHTEQTDKHIRFYYIDIHPEFLKVKPGHPKVSFWKLLKQNCLQIGLPSSPNKQQQNIRGLQSTK